MGIREHKRLNATDLEYATSHNEMNDGLAKEALVDYLRYYRSLLPGRTEGVNARDTSVTIILVSAEIKTQLLPNMNRRPLC
jgi:hypothetical protein